MDKGWDQTCPGGKYSKKGSGCWQIPLVPQGPCPAFAEDGWWQPALAPGPPASSSVQACQCWALNTAPGAASCLRSTCCLCPSAAQLLQTLPWAPLPKTDACVGRKEGRLLEPISDLWRGGAVVWGPWGAVPMSSALRKREENEFPTSKRTKGPSCTRLFREDPSFSILQGQHRLLSFIHSFSKYLLSTHHVTSTIPSNRVQL